MSENRWNPDKLTVPAINSGFSHKLSEIRVNPLRLVNSVFMIIAPFLSWITFFGVESNLWQIFNQTHLQISQFQAFASLVSGILLIAGALLVLKNARIGMFIQAAGLLIFLIPSYSLYGYRYVGSGLFRFGFLISPGLGLIMAGVGLVIGFISLGVEKIPISLAESRIRTREGIYKTGLFIAVIAIVIDGLNHAALGQIQGFFGLNLVEEFIHFGFLIPLLVLTVSWSMRERFKQGAWRTRIVFIAFVFLAEDAAFHYFGGNISSFIGHTSAEIFLHLAGYYGFAFLLISRLFMKD